MPRILLSLFLLVSAALAPAADGFPLGLGGGGGSSGPLPLSGDLAGTTDAASVVTIGGVTVQQIPRVIAKSAHAVSLTGTTTETALATVPINPSDFPVDSIMEIWALWSETGGTGKNYRIKCGGQTWFDLSAVSAPGNIRPTWIFHQQASSQKLLNPNNSTGVGNEVSPTQTTIDFTSAKNLVFDGALGDSADSITLEGYVIIVYP